MSDSGLDSPNAQQFDYWNKIVGPNWVRLQTMFDEELAPLGKAALERADIATGERVLDTGCGCGATTLELARRVGPQGSVLGLDISEPMLSRATERANEASVKNVRFQRADAQTHTFAEEPFDLLFSRFGVMFFDDPRAAFANLLGALRPGGRLTFVCWRRVEENQWASIMLDAMAQHINVDLPKPGVPGPFAFGDGAAVQAILAAAGFVDVGVEPLDETVTVGGHGTLEEIAENLTQFGFIGGAIRRAGIGDTSQIVASLKEAITPFAADGNVRMKSGTWIVTARRNA